MKSEPKTCTCKDWLPNIKIINGFIVTQSVMAWGNKMGYTGKPFVYCPWCGKKLKREAPEKLQEGKMKKGCVNDLPTTLPPLPPIGQHVYVKSLNMYM